MLPFRDICLAIVVLEEKVRAFDKEVAIIIIFVFSNTFDKFLPKSEYLLVSSTINFSCSFGTRVLLSYVSSNIQKPII